MPGPSRLQSGRRFSTPPRRAPQSPAIARRSVTIGSVVPPEAARHRGAFVIWALVCCMAPTVGAMAAESWRQIAAGDFVFRGQIQRIDLTRPLRFVRGLKIRTRGRRMTFSSVRVVYGDGQTQPVRRRIRLLSGQTSAVIDVPAPGKFVKQIVLVPDISAPRRHRIRVEILGLQDDDDMQRRPGDADVSNTSGELAPIPARKTDAKAQQAAATKDANARSLDHETDNRRAGEPDEPGKHGTRRRIANTATAANEAKHLSAVVLGQPTNGATVLIGALPIEAQATQSQIVFDKPLAKFAQLRLRPTGANLFLENVAITYDDETRASARFGVSLFRNTTSRRIAIDPKRFVRSVLFNHRPVDGIRRRGIRIQLYATLADHWLLPTSEGARLNDGWLLLAAREGQYLARSGGRLPVARNRGGFGELRVTGASGAMKRAKLNIRFAGRPNGGMVQRVAGTTKGWHSTVELAQRAPIAGLEFELGRRALQSLPATARVAVWVRF